MSSKQLQLLHYTFNVKVSAQSLELSGWFICCRFLDDDLPDSQRQHVHGVQSGAEGRNS